MRTSRRVDVECHRQLVGKEFAHVLPLRKAKLEQVDMERSRRGAQEKGRPNRDRFRVKTMLSETVFHCCGAQEMLKAENSTCS